MAGQIAELAHRTLKGNFRNIDPSRSRIVLLDAAPSVLGSFGERLSGKAARELADIGVDVQLGMKVVDIDATGIDVVDGTGQRRRIESVCKMWAAGVSASPLGAQLAAASGAKLDRVGRVEVEPDCTLPGHPDVFVVGDLMALDDLPGVAQVAIQSAEHAADQIARRLRGDEIGHLFQYKDKGSMATVSRFHAVASVGRLRLAGFPAWVMWLVVHLLYLVGFKNRLTTVLHWTHSFVGRGRAERVTTSQQVLARSALESTVASWLHHRNDAKVVGACTVRARFATLTGGVGLAHVGPRSWPEPGCRGDTRDVRRPSRARHRDERRGADGASRLPDRCRG